ncbi:hypothetical protein B0T16DRAFT_394277 [Cercophora newfieldiana]|uniref:DUF1996 domain-containing protein n=1 Tax=Cercophora newfieldiana TaxID=92897 RepID=A0AA40CKB6_9PEZI|nr:hypothetical protein B0T16DRAFT_394277 [Cercophora newfieldiana]
MSAIRFLLVVALGASVHGAINVPKPRQLPPDFDPSTLPTYNGTGPTMLRFGCNQLSIDRIDPLVNPGAVPSTHQHQIVGGDAFDASMPLSDIAALSQCTTCSYSADFSNYWTSNLYFRARNGSYKRVPQFPGRFQPFFGNNTFASTINGGMLVYYVSPGQNQLTSFAPGFRMFFGDASLRAPPDEPPHWQQNLSTQTCFRCYNAPDFGGDDFRPCLDPRVDTMHLPTGPCYGIRSNVLFPTCWDGVTLDTADHKSHVAYPVEGPHIFDGIGTAEVCPPSHPVKIPQVMLEINWDTTAFNNPEDWPEDGSQPFVLSTGDGTGYSQHADYVFGWRGDSLKVGMEAGCAGADCPGMATQGMGPADGCAVGELAGESYDGSNAHR